MEKEATLTLLKSKYLNVISYPQVISFYSYGFTLDETNLFASLEFRVVIGTNPKEKVTDPAVLLPNQETLDDFENIDYSTELLRVKSYRISEGLLAYLRSVLINNYEGEDKNVLMVSCPRSFEFEIFVLEFAVKLLEEFARSN